MEQYCSEGKGCNGRSVAKGEKMCKEPFRVVQVGVLADWIGLDTDQSESDGLCRMSHPHPRMVHPGSICG